MAHDLYTLLILSMAGGVITVTVTRSSLFEPIRSWGAGRSELLGALLSCPYCFGHWVGLLLAPLDSMVNLLGYFVSALAITWGSVICGAIVFNAAKLMKE